MVNTENENEWISKSFGFWASRPLFRKVRTKRIVRLERREGHQRCRFFHKIFLNMIERTFSHDGFFLFCHMNVETCASSALNICQEPKTCTFRFFFYLSTRSPLALQRVVKGKLIKLVNSLASMFRCFARPSFYKEKRRFCSELPYWVCERNDTFRRSF